MEKDSVVPAATWYRGLAGDKLITFVAGETYLHASEEQSNIRWQICLKGLRLPTFPTLPKSSNLPAQSLTKPFFRRFSQRHGVTPVLLDRRKFLSSQQRRLLCIRSIHFKILPRKEMLHLRKKSTAPGFGAIHWCLTRIAKDQNIYPPVRNHGNGKSTIYRWFSHIQPSTYRRFSSQPCLITRRYSEEWVSSSPTIWWSVAFAGQNTFKRESCDCFL